MKKVILLMMLLFCSLVLTYAQNDTTMYIAEQNGEYVVVCSNQYNRVIVYGIYGCDEFYWTINGEIHQENPVIITPTGAYGEGFSVAFTGCNGFWEFSIEFRDDRFLPTEFIHDVWKRQGETITLSAVGADSLDWFDYQWSTGGTAGTIEVTETGTYSCEISYLCGTATRTFIVRDNVEIYRSGVDPATNKNRVLWQTTPEQAAYISNVKVERDGMVVGTVPYLDGQFLDNIGSENAARIYRITAIASDGTECPIPSYQFGTFNTIYSPDIANPNLMNFSWEDPFIEEGSPYEVIAYRIGRVDNSGEFIVIDQLSANVHLGKYDMDLFNGDYGIVAAVFNDSKRDYEELAFSNRSDNGIVGIGEQNGENFGIYPNPAKDCFTVEGTGVITVTNTLGQTILTQEIDGKATIELPQGMYCVKLNGTTRKIVVE